MALPINISELIHGKVVEWERLEFKQGWNPEDILHSVCAFANDINNWGGGYIVIGINANEGIPQFPPKGLPVKNLDKIQGELIGICYKIQPNYLPITQPYEIDGHHILVVWCPAGDMRPYSCPSTLGNDARRQYYIRSGSRSIVAQGANQTRLVELTAKLPFDDRINQEAQVNDLELGLIREFLQEVGSDLFEDSTTMSFPDLCKAMQIARGPVEALRPVNAGLLFFNKAPHQFFQRAWIELAIHKDDSGRNYVPKVFKGPLHKQIRECLAYLQNEVFKSETRKITGQAENVTISNYPYNAVEEALSNAVYHKSYSEGKPIEIQVLYGSMEILSYPGPLPPVTNADLQQRRVIARDYRNRRIGDFLKELKLTEGKATGFPLIKDEMAKNGSPGPVFYTDDDRTLFLVTLPCHPDFPLTKSVTKRVAKVGAKFSRVDVDQILADGDDFKSLANLLKNDISEVRDYVREQIIAKSLTNSEPKLGTKMEPKSGPMSRTKSRPKIEPKLEPKIEPKINVKSSIMPGGKLIEIIDILQTHAISRSSLFESIRLFNNTKNFNTYIKPLIEARIIELTIPDKPNSKNQKYRLTPTGKNLLK